MRANTDTPPTLRYQQKRETVLAHAALLFNQHGLKSATLASIAESVGLATNSITYYYRKKEDLAQACLLRTVDAFDVLTLAAAGHARAEDRVRAYFHAVAELAADIVEKRRPPLMQFNDIRALPQPQAETVFPAYTAMFRRVRALIDGPGAPCGDALNARAHLLLSVANWMGPWLEERYEADEYPRVAARIADFVIGGLGGRCEALPAITGWRPRPDEDTMAAAYLRTATLLLNEQGYRGASVERIAGHMNRTKGAFYHHHDNKLDLISACFERTFDILRQVLATAQQAPGAGRDRAYSAALALAMFQLSPSGPLLRTSALSALPDPARRREARRMLHRLTERVTDMLVGGMADGSVRLLDPGIAAAVITACITASANLSHWTRDVRPDNVAQAFVRPLFEGVLSPSASLAGD